MQESQVIGVMLILSVVATLVIGLCFGLLAMAAYDLITDIWTRHDERRRGKR